MLVTEAGSGDASPAHRVGRTGAMLAGWVLGGAFGVVARVRGGKPIHSRGQLRTGRLEVTPAPGPRTGVKLLDSPAEHACLVRISRSVGLPRPAPDIEGLAIRVPTAPEPADLLFASTGAGRWGRHLLVPRVRLEAGPLTTLLPLRSPTGPVLLGFFPAQPDADGDATFRMRWSRPAGSWHDVGWLRLGGPAGDEEDPPVRFDPVLRPVPGLAHYPVWAALREPPYLSARAAHPAGSDDPGDLQHADDVTERQPG